MFKPQKQFLCSRQGHEQQMRQNKSSQHNHSSRQEKIVFSTQKQLLPQNPKPLKIQKISQIIYQLESCNYDRKKGKEYYKRKVEQDLQASIMT